MKCPAPAIWTRLKGEAAPGIALLLVLVLMTLPGSLGRFLAGGRLSDSAYMAEFAVRVAPLGALPRGEAADLRLFEAGGPRGLAFEAVNGGEVDVCITPHIEGVWFETWVEGHPTADFSVAAGETMTFWVVIHPDGLSELETETALWLDIRQKEG